MKSLAEIESVGWGFFVIVLAVLAGPCIYAIWSVTASDAPGFERVGLGLALAALFAAGIAWGVNDLLYRRMLRIHAAEKKVEKQNERKKKKRR